MSTASVAIEAGSSIRSHCLKFVRHTVFGETLLPQEFTIGLEQPQREISVSLRAEGISCDVTSQHMTACTAPLLLCVGFHGEQYPTEQRLRGAVLTFRESGEPGRVPGEIRLRPNTVISLDGSQFVLFEARSSANHCLHRTRLWAHHLLQAYQHWRRNDPPDIRMTLREERAAAVTFIRPHPLCLVSVGDRLSGNIFPMNLMGDLGSGYFGFALRDQRVAADLVERAGRLVVSGIPISHCPLAYRFASNHKKERVDWEALPFGTRPSPTFGIPAPDFAMSVRELEVLKVHRLGSHRLFIARIAHDEISQSGQQACVVHGFYQFWRMKGNSGRLRTALAQDSLHKRGVQPFVCDSKHTA